MIRFATRFAVLFVTWSLFIQPLFAQENWPRFRGEHGLGASQASTIPSNWTDQDYNWRIKLPGSGNSSPVVWGSRIFLTSANQDTAQRHVVCVDAESGKINWTKKFASTRYRMHSRNTFASGTPAVDAEHVYVSWATPDALLLKAFTHAGEEIWSKDLGKYVARHGFAASPIVYKDKVILSNSQQGAKLDQGEKPGVSEVLAFNKKTGRQLWKSERVSSNVSYSVPCVCTIDGVDQLINTSTSEGFYSLDPETGTEHWSSKGVFSMRTVASPICADGLLFGSTGSGGGGNYVVAMRPGNKPQVAYEVRKSASYVPSPLVYNGLLFIFNDRGIISCVESKTGKPIWRERVDGEFSGSPVQVQDRIYCISDAGDLFVLAASRQFKKIAVIPLGETSRCTPAIAGGRMYLRTDNHLMSIGG